MQAGREIKFRGMDIQGNWHFGNLAVLQKAYKGIEAGCYISNAAGAPFAYAVRPETVGQFTGLRDKNGWEIYEGDIVKFRHSSEPEYNLDATVVEWVPQWCRFCIDENSGLNANMNLEVIGNIYENPELLEVG